MFTDNETDMDCSVREMWKSSQQQPSKKLRHHHDREYSQINREKALDSHKIDEMFKSGFHS